MCGIFGFVRGNDCRWQKPIRTLVSHSEQRGRDSSGLLTISKSFEYKVLKSDHTITSLYKNSIKTDPDFIIGHSRLVTNGMLDNQPVVSDDIIAFHNGIIVNDKEAWKSCARKRNLNIDTELLTAIASECIENDSGIEQIPNTIFEKCKGVIACALVLAKQGKLILFSNNGSLYLSVDGQNIAFSSEEYPLREIGCRCIKQVFETVIFDIPKNSGKINITEKNNREINLIPNLNISHSEEKLLQYNDINLRRCSRCILPETMPFIFFDNNGVCNYCLNYSPRNIPRPKEDLLNLVEKYRKKKGNDCIIPFSGGRDSCYGLHLAVKELGMKPIAYTYDWGMVTDLARRNISRMCAELNVENIIIADDISQKRCNIKKNLSAWLKSPHLGMISILTAGDKHFFNHVEKVKKQTGIKLNLWGVNPLEVTHFKAGFLGIPPDFEEKLVYSNGALKQIRYQYLRLCAMLKSPSYFNSSLWDTLSGEYYRSFKPKTDYFHLFDFWKWDENIVNASLEGYDWEKAPDTNSTWRIGDGTAAFYNYIYYTVAGFTEHDTFRSNQIREGDISREYALELVNDENKPRYPNIRWYLDAIGMEFSTVVKKINSIPTLY